MSCFHCSVRDIVYSLYVQDSVCYWTKLNYHDRMKEKSIAEMTVKVLLKQNPLLTKQLITTYVSYSLATSSGCGYYNGRKGGSQVKQNEE